MRLAPLMLGAAAVALLGGCAVLKPEHAIAPVQTASLPVIAIPAVRRPVLIQATMAPIPNPPPARSLGHKARAHAPEAAAPAERVALANAAARVQPTRAAYANAEQVYSFEDGSLYQVYAAPGRVTDIELQEGEQLSATGPVAAGDTTRWVIGDTVSGSGAGRRVHILVKPTRPSLETNLVINTDRRTYHLELRATPATYMASVAWKYPEDERLAQASDPSRFTVPAVAVEQLNFAYRLSGDKPRWRPVRVFDDGRQTVIEFPQSIVQTEMPPLFVGGPDGRPTDLVNYRVNGERIIVDRLFDVAELRLGDKRGAQRVRIERIRSR